MKHILIIFAGLLIFIGCEKEKIEQKPSEQLPNILLENFSLTETKMGKKLWTLDARIARVYDEIINVDTVHMMFYDENQIEFSILHAPGGRLNTKTHNILVGDSVVVYTNDSTKLFTDSLFWENDSQKILTNCYVKILKKDGTIIEGKGLRADPHLDKIEIIGETKGISPITLPDINK